MYSQMIGPALDAQSSSCNEDQEESQCVHFDASNSCYCKSVDTLLNAHGAISTRLKGIFRHAYSVCAAWNLVLF